MKISDEKLVTFAVGQQKKSRFQKAREEKEIKRKQEEEEAAAAFTTFAASFAEDDDEPKAFVKAGGSNTSSDVYKPVRKNEKISEMDKMLNEMRENEATQSKFSQNKAKGAREIDDFLIELKANQSDVSHNNEPSNYDPNSTNLYIGNLSPATTEDHLRRILSKYGSIDSVKIMWPRTEEERQRKRNFGFANFKYREDAEDALNALQDVELDGNRITVCWGKSVRSTATSDRHGRQQVNHDNRSEHWSRDSWMDKESSRPPSSLSARPPPAYPPASFAPPVHAPPSSKVASSVPQLRIQLPLDSALRRIIDETARSVALHGRSFEQNLESRERHNPQFQFLSKTSALRDYFRWRTYGWRTEPFQYSHEEEDEGLWIVPPPAPEEQHASASESKKRGFSEQQADAESDRRKRHRSPEHSAVDESREIVKLTGKTGAQLERARDKERIAQQARLTNEDYDQWLELLRTLSLSRESIKEAMAFAFDKIESCVEIVSLVVNKLMLPSKHAAVKMAGLYLLPDILHNSGAPIKGASHYRSLIQETMPRLMKDFAALYRSTTGRMSAFQIEDRVRRVLATWSDWSVFPVSFLQGLECLFLMSEADWQLYSGAEQGETSIAASEDLRRRSRLHGIGVSDEAKEQELQRKLGMVEQYIAKTAGVTMPAPEVVVAPKKAVQEEEEEIDGVPVTEMMDDDIDGAQLPPLPIQQRWTDVSGEDIDGDPLEEDVDGVPLAEEEDIDGAPLEEEEEDLDGVPMDD